MTPTQREAAARLVDALDAYHTRSEHKEAAALLRELLAEPVINHKMTTEPAEPQGEPAMAAEIEGDCLVAWNASAYGHSKADTVHPMFLTAFTLGYRAAENATHPPQQRQPLTDYEIDRFWMNRPDLHEGELLPQLRDFARAIERAVTGEQK